MVVGHLAALEDQGHVAAGELLLHEPLLEGDEPGVLLGGEAAGGAAGRSLRRRDGAGDEEDRGEGREQEGRAGDVHVVLERGERRR